MKKIFSYILIVLVVIQLFAPFSILSDKKNNLELKSSKAEAADLPFDEYGYKNAFPDSSLSVHTTYSDETSATGSVDVKIGTGLPENSDASLHWMHADAKGSTAYWGLINTGVEYFATNVFVLIIEETSTQKAGWIDASYSILSGIDANGVSYNYADKRGDPAMPVSIETNILLSTNSIKPLGENGLNKLIPNNDYTISFYYKVWNGSGSGEEWGENIPGVSDGSDTDYIKIKSISFKSATKEIQITGGIDLNNGESKVVAGEIQTPECSITDSSTWGGCIGKVLYWAIFKPTSYFFTLSGKILDLAVDYSTKDTSYRSSFVVEGWGVIRDFCNMFFIFILLYIAFGTILKLHSVKTKEMIVNVVIIGLFINFSLFAVQVIIDASNMLTRVFYNSNTIVIGPKNGNTVQGELGDHNEIKLSEGIVGKINPQRLLLKAGEADGIRTKGAVNENEETQKNGAVSSGTFILVVLLASVINIVGLVVFLSSAIIFITRVIGLWLAMIFAPMAFFSYTVPALQDMEFIGWKKWWPETIKMAFLAPVFVFFLYLIIKFLETGLGLAVSDSKGGMDFILGIFLPFIFIMILLMKSKDIAKDMSGKMGQAITNGLAAVGGMALGAGVGGLAMAGRASIGRIANKVNNSNWVNDAASGKKGAVNQFLGKNLKTFSGVGAKSSFDFRQTKAGNMFTKETGMNLNTGTNFVGLDTKKGLGGYTGVQQRKIDKENKFAESLGYDHHKYENISEEISAKEKELADYRADKTKNHNSDDYKASVAEMENSIAAKKKEQERVKTGRVKEYSLTNKRKSGKIYDIEKTDEAYFKAKAEYEKDSTNMVKKKAFEATQIYRDANGNIKKFGHASSDGARAAKQVIKEFAKGMAQGAGVGALAGSVLPGVGTLGGIITGGLVGGIRSAVKYSGSTNRKVGEENHGHKEEYKDNYNPGTASHSTPSPSAHTTPHGGGDSHAHGH